MTRPTAQTDAGGHAPRAGAIDGPTKSQRATTKKEKQSRIVARKKKEKEEEAKENGKKRETPQKEVRRRIRVKSFPGRFPGPAIGGAGSTNGRARAGRPANRFHLDR